MGEHTPRSKKRPRLLFFSESFQRLFDSASFGLRLPIGRDFSALFHAGLFNAFHLRRFRFFFLFIRPRHGAVSRPLRCRAFRGAAALYHVFRLQLCRAAQASATFFSSMHVCPLSPVLAFIWLVFSIFSSA